MEWSKVASSLDSLTKEISEARRAVERDSGSKDKVKSEAANRALASVDDLRDTLRGWYSFYDGYDPLSRGGFRSPTRAWTKACSRTPIFSASDWVRSPPAWAKALAAAAGDGRWRRQVAGPAEVAAALVPAVAAEAVAAQQAPAARCGRHAAAAGDARSGGRPAANRQSQPRARRPDRRQPDRPRGSPERAQV